MQNQKQHKDMDFDFFKTVVSEMRTAGVEELGLFYIGESLLCRWLPEAVKFAKDIGFPYVFLTTNGSLADEARVQPLMEAGLDSLKFSMNYSSKTQFRHVTGMAPSNFDKMLVNLKSTWELREAKGYKTKLYASSIEYNGIQATVMEKLVAEEIEPFVDEHYWLPLLSFGDQATEQEKEHGMLPVRGNPGRLEMMRTPLPCWAVFREGHITSEGMLSACCFDGSDNWKMADLNQVDFMHGWNSVAFQLLRRKHLDGDVHGTPCEGCIHGKG
jgi:hypothetical protein